MMIEQKILLDQEDRKVRKLAHDFTPGENDVVVSKGKKYCNHSGNLRLRRIVQSKISLYRNALSKASKSSIISEVIMKIEDGSNYSGFVRYNKEEGRWYEAEEVLAREKTSQAFRDALRHYYKSSRENKRKPRFEHDLPSIAQAVQLQHKRHRSQMESSTSKSACTTPAFSPQHTHEHDKDLFMRIYSLMSTQQKHFTDENPFEPTPIKHTEVDRLPTTCIDFRSELASIFDDSLQYSGRNPENIFKKQKF